MKIKTESFLLLVIFLFFFVSLSFINQTIFVKDKDSYNKDNRLIDSNASEQIQYSINETKANTYTLDEQAYSQACTISDDRIVVAWQSEGQDGSGTVIYACVFDGTTGLNTTGEFRLNNYTSGDQREVSLCSLYDDIFIAVWESDG